MSSFMIPRPQGSYCSVHNWNIVPILGRYLLVAAWYYGGRIYANDMTRGQDVESILLPYTPYGQHRTHLNAQTQEDLYLPSMTAVGQLSPTR
jgi:hypothetical protein